jgi:flavodoxin
MKAIVIYDSKFGNSKIVATTVAKEIGARLIHVADANADDIAGAELVVVGSPTHGGMFTKAVQDFLNSLPKDVFAGKRVAAFDTRMQPEDQSKPLEIIMKITGFAAPKIEKQLVLKGGRLAGASKGFIVADKEGPLLETELDLARQWAKSL